MLQRLIHFYVLFFSSDVTQAERSETESEGSHKLGKDYEIIEREEANDSDKEQADDEDNEDWAIRRWRTVWVIGNNWNILMYRLSC